MKMTDECEHKEYTVVNLNLSFALSECGLLLASAAANTQGTQGRPDRGAGTPAAPHVP